MMKTERDIVEKKAWEKPKVLVLSVKETNGGTIIGTPENTTFGS